VKIEDSNDVDMIAFSGGVSIKNVSEKTVYLWQVESVNKAIGYPLLPGRRIVLKEPIPPLYVVG